MKQTAAPTKNTQTVQQRRERQQKFNEFTHKITNHINLCVNKSHIFPFT